jgi:hypothetical protein
MGDAAKGGKMHTKRRTRLLAGGAALLLACVGSVASADDISHSLTAGTSSISLAVGQSGGTTYTVKPTNGDGKQGCNLSQQSSLKVAVQSSDSSVATVSPSEITFTSCGDVIPVTVTGVAAGSATIFLSQLANTTAGSFNFAPATFGVDVTGAPADTKAPTITYVGQSPEANGHGWNNSAVTLTWSCDDGDGIGVDESASVTSVTLTSDGAGQEATGKCVDLAGNESTDTVTGVNIDSVEPGISYVGQSPEANGNGWNNEAVTLTWSCDALGGSGIDGAASSTSATIASEGADHQATGKCVDLAGNESTDTVTDIDIDLTAPDLTWDGGPADGSSHYFGSVPAASTCEAVDTLSGPDGCDVSGYSNAVGVHTVTAEARDLAGNVTTQTRTYEVLAWTLVGYHKPVDMNGAWNSVKGGSTVPLKFEVWAGDTQLTDVAVVESFKVAGAACTVDSAKAEDIDLVTTGNTALRYDAVDEQFIQNWKTPRNPGACYTVTMKTLDQSVISANFKLK